MPNVQEPHLHLEIAHVLFMDVVGYSKLLVNEQREMMQQLNQLVRKTAQFQVPAEEVSLSLNPGRWS